MKRKMVLRILAFALLVAVFAAYSRAAITADSSGLSQGTTASVNATNALAGSSQETSEATFSDSDEKTTYSAQSSDIDLSEYPSGAVVSITAAGEYLLSGTLTDGQVVVDAGDSDKVQLYLDNAEITNTSGSAILVENADKVIITLNAGTVNTITDGASYSDLDEEGEPNAAIFSHDDLTINGSGALTIQANYADGVQSRDDLKITGGDITISAVGDGLFGNDSFEMKAATVAISAGDDAIHSDGDIIIESGSLKLSCGDDGIHADGTLTVNDGTIDITACYEGLEATDVIVNGGMIDIVADDDGINGAGGVDGSASIATTGRGRDGFSASQGTITINGGTITIAAALSGAGDGMDANGALTITGGDTVIVTPSSYRDYSALDSDAGLSLTGGQVRSLDSNGNYTTLTESSAQMMTRGKR